MDHPVYQMRCIALVGQIRVLRRHDGLGEMVGRKMEEEMVVGGRSVCYKRGPSMRQSRASLMLSN